MLLPLDWNRVEPKSGRFTWKADDAAVNAARARKLDVTLVLGPNAVWAVSSAWQVPPMERSRSIPWTISLWERYVRQAATHFKGRVQSWQVREQPNIRNFRGSRTEYLRLVAAAARVLRQVDPNTLLVVPEAGNLDVAEIDRLCGSSLRAACGVLGLYVPASTDLSSPALAWAVLNQDVPGLTKAPPRQLWVLGSDGNPAPDSWRQQYLLSWVFGAARFYLPAAVVDEAALATLSALRYRGYLRLGPQAWAFAFEDKSGPLVVAWSTQETDLAASDFAPVLDPAALAQSSGSGTAPAAEPTRDAPKLHLGPRPALIRGLDLTNATHPGIPGRDDVLAGRPGPGPDPSQPISADYGRESIQESGLYNRSLRGRAGGRVEEELHDGHLCLRTRISTDQKDDTADNPWVYFDVDDRWLYFGRGKTPLAITVECAGAYLGEKQLGFNIMYDSTTGYRFTKWQWVEPGPGWKSYRVELADASFANRNGYDFRINVKGSKQDLWISSVKVEKLPAPSLHP